MANTTVTANYMAITPVRHNLRLYMPGKPIALDASDAARLLAMGVIRPADTPIVVVSIPLTLGQSTLGKMTLPELSDYATKLGLTITEGTTKDQILTAIAASATAAEIPAGTAAPTA